MQEEILEDIRMILRDKSLLGEFIKIDDVSDMYDFCINLKKESESSGYSKEEFFDEVEDLISGLPKNICDYYEW